MSTRSSTGEVFGEKVLYGAIIALSAAILFVAVASSMSLGPAAKTGVAGAQSGETVVVSASTGEVS